MIKFGSMRFEMEKKITESVSHAIKVLKKCIYMYIFLCIMTNNINYQYKYDY